jgi:hypothetical protein
MLSGLIVSFYDVCAENMRKNLLAEARESTQGAKGVCNPIDGTTI